MLRLIAGLKRRLRFSLRGWLEELELESGEDGTSWILGCFVMRFTRLCPFESRGVLIYLSWVSVHGTSSLFFWDERLAVSFIGRVVVVL